MIRRWQPYVFWATATGIAVSLGSVAGPVVWHLMGEIAVRPPPLSALAAAAPSDEPGMLASILALAPFGAAAEPSAPATVQSPITADLGLTLIGVAVAVPASASRAIIAGGAKPVSGYAIGDAITATVTLSEVHPDHVIVNADGQATLLYFRETPLRETARDPLTDGQSATVSDAYTEDTDPDAVIARYRAQIQQNPQTVMDSLGLQATDQGYLITPAAHPGVRQAGFRPGDMVTSVNGKAVGNVAQDTIYFDEIAASGRASVEVLRDGQSIIMTFPLR